MKTALVAIIISFVLVFVYMVVTLAIAPFFGGDLFSPPGQTPLSLPWIVYYRIAPDSIQDFFASDPSTYSLLKFLMLFSNALLYAVPIYLMLRFRTKKQTA